MSERDVLADLQQAADRKWQGDPACQQAGLFARAAAEIAALREALSEIRDRIKGHPAYEDLTEDEEMETGGDTAELSYLARVADAVLNKL
jgi:acyl-CoA reductase-like NAD-dependent aldehyde dehydrogenase